MIVLVGAFSASLPAYMTMIVSAMCEVSTEVVGDEDHAVTRPVVAELDERAGDRLLRWRRPART